MLNIKLIAIGKLSAKSGSAFGGKDTIEDYLKRLKPYAKIDLLEIPEEPFRDINEREKVKEKEAEKILKLLPSDSFVIALHERGKEYTSEKLAKFLEEKSTQGDLITLIIGGPLGWHQSVLDRADMQLSLSQLTFPHQLVRVVLLEQLYRAATIIHGKQYHY